MLKYKWLLFDADGTLFDYDKAETNALQRTFLAFGFEFQEGFRSAYREINDKIWRAFERSEITQKQIRTERFALLSKAIGIDFEVEAFSQRYLQYLGEGTYLLDGAEEILETLQNKVGMLLITNGLKDVQRSRLAKSTIAHYFSGIVISEEVGSAKPDEGIFEVAFDKMGKPPKHEVLIIGDSLTSDIQGGNRYGIDTCWFNPFRRTCENDTTIDYEIQQLGELLPILGITKPS